MSFLKRLVSYKKDKDEILYIEDLSVMNKLQLNVRFLHKNYEKNSNVETFLSTPNLQKYLNEFEPGKGTIIDTIIKKGDYDILSHLESNYDIIYNLGSIIECTSIQTLRIIHRKVPLHTTFNGLNLLEHSLIQGNVSKFMFYMDKNLLVSFRCICDCVKIGSIGVKNVLNYSTKKFINDEFFKILKSVVDYLDDGLSPHDCLILESFVKEIAKCLIKDDFDTFQIWCNNNSLQVFKSEHRVFITNAFIGNNMDALEFLDCINPLYNLPMKTIFKCNNLHLIQKYWNDTLGPSCSIEVYINSVHAEGMKPKIEIIDWLMKECSAEVPYTTIINKLYYSMELLDLFRYETLKPEALEEVVKSKNIQTIKNVIEYGCPHSQQIWNAINYGCCEEIIKILIDFGNNVNHAVGGITPVKLAFDLKKYNIAKILIDHGAIVDFKLKGLSKYPLHKDYFKNLIYVNMSMDKV